MSSWRPLGPWLILFFSFYVEAAAAESTSIDAATVEAAAQSREWQVLLHYREPAFGSSRSEVAESDFFLDRKEGPTSPFAELKATIEGFQKNPELICKFPARARFLNEKLQLRRPPQKCQDFADWKTIFTPHSLSLVFASSFFGNPASAFGHTFLRIDGAITPPMGPKSSLLDYGLNFAAQVPPGDGPITFAYNGVAGGYIGQFSIVPYVEKIQEYRDREERDLWEYQLNVSPAQIERLLEHLWELRAAKVPYYFANKNCSYQILALLEVARPEWRLTDDFKYWALPTDTIKTVTKIPDAIRDVRLRPSLHHQLRARFAEMSSAERQMFFALRAGTQPLSGTETAPVLDALMDDQQFRHGADSRLYPLEQKQRLDRLLIARARATGQSPPLALDHLQGRRPDYGLGSKKLALYSGQSGGRGFRGLEVRPTFYDGLDANPSTMGFSELSLLKFSLRHDDARDDTHIDEIDFIRITSFTPVDALSNELSWTVRLSRTTSPDDSIFGDKIGHTTLLHAGFGYSAYARPKTENALVYAFLKLNLENNDDWHENFRYGPSLKIGHYSRWAEDIRFGLHAEYFNFAADNGEALSQFGVAESQLAWRWQKNSELRFSTRRLFSTDIKDLPDTIEENPESFWTYQAGLGFYF